MTSVGQLQYFNFLLQNIFLLSSTTTMPKEKSANPVAAQRKADKRKEINKSKKNVQEQRNEKLARRNPDRLQKQIDELKELDGRNQLRPKDKENLAQLEKDLRGIKRAREALGDAAPKFPSHERRNDRGDGQRGDTRQEQRDRRQNLGKRRRDEVQSDSDGNDTDPEVRSIPMPRDTPPPMPRQKFKDPQIGPDGQRMPHALPTKPVQAAPQLVYSSAPQLRDLKKEATKFVPAAVRQKQKQVKGQGRLLEPEEIDKLEQAGYYAAKKAADEAGEEAARLEVGAEARAAPPGTDDVDMELQLKRFEEEMKGLEPPQDGQYASTRQVQLEEVDDDGD